MSCRGVHLLCFALVCSSFLAASESVRPLEGMKLRCCTLIESPVVYLDPAGKRNHDFAGIAIDYLHLLEDKLGFRCDPLKLFTASKRENRGFTGFVYEMEECTRNGLIIDSPKCQCDIGVGGWNINVDRMERVDFVAYFVNDNFRILTHVDNIDFYSTSGAFFLTAFSTTTWLAVFGLLLFFIFLKLFERNFAPPDPQVVNLPPGASTYARVRQYLCNSRLPKRIKRATMNTLLGIIGQTTDDVQGNSQTTRQWCVSYVLILCGLFLVLAYEATMTASLVQEVPISDFRTIQDLKTCRVPAEEVCLPKGGAAFAFWKTAIAKSECNQKPGVPSPKIVDSYEEGHQKVASKQCKYFLASGATTTGAAQWRFCGQVATTGEPFLPTGMSYVLPKDSNLTRPFSNATLHLLSLDAIGTIDQFLRKEGECKERGSVSLTFGRLRIFFVMAFSACVLLFIIVILFPQRRREVQNRGERNEAKGSFESSEDFDSRSEIPSSSEDV